MDDLEPAPGDEVLVPIGLYDYGTGTVCEVYGPAGGRRVVVWLTTDFGGDEGVERTTVALPLNKIRRASPAA